MKPLILWIMVVGGGVSPEGQAALAEGEAAPIHRSHDTGTHAVRPSQGAAKGITQHDVLPIVLLRCTACHGRRLQQGELDLRTPAAMRKGGRSGPALVPGDPDASPMVKRIESEACPPREMLLRFFVKRPSSSEVEILREWIAAGAPGVDIPAEVVTHEPDWMVRDADRQHWAFQPPETRTEAESVDEFIFDKLKENGLDFSPQADRNTLIRRAYLDLTGVPPDRAEWILWHGSDDPQWYRRMIDALLASPRYGERWGRYWLDLAGYADSEGGISADPVREVAWKYRDYVIAAFNDDKPYDRFLLEQIAGDELLDYEAAAVVTEEMVQNLIATGFLRMGIDQTGSRTMNFVPERLGVIADAITVVSSGLMGLTMECARCHSHKYDPIPHRDYYRFKAIFQGALDEHDWLSFQTRSLDVATPSSRERFASVNPPLESQLGALQSRLKEAIVTLQIVTLEAHYPVQSDADRQRTLLALKEADNTRTQPQKLLVEMLQRAELLPDSAQPKGVLAARRDVEEIEREIARVRQEMEPPLAIRALWDRGDPSPTYMLLRGEHDKPGPPVGPGVPSVLTDGRTPLVIKPPFPEGTPKTGRRLAFARWLTRVDHPLTARVMVNRIWYHHFGTGLVKTLDNFGVQGESPSHPELLDWLAVQFTRGGWSIKQMHRLIMNSRTYRQSSRITQERQRIDPQNRFLSRMSLRRMDAEALRDSLLFVAGKLDETRGGPPAGVSIDRDGFVSVRATARGDWRRSVYLLYRRTELPTMLEAFDYPEMGPNCVARTVSIVSPQSLLLLNNQHVRELAAALAARVEGIVGVAGGGDRGRQVEITYQIALSRPPTRLERRLGIETLEALEEAWQGTPHVALETYCHTVLNAAAFVYID